MLLYEYSGRSFSYFDVFGRRLISKRLDRTVIYQEVCPRMTNAHSSVLDNTPSPSRVRKLTQTQQCWYVCNNGTSQRYNTPLQTGATLDARQGKNPNYLGTCGIVSCVNILWLAGRRSTTEAEVLSYAVSHQLCNTDNICPTTRGGTTPDDRKKLLEQFGIESELLPASIDSIATYVCAGRGVIISVSAGKLWGIPLYRNSLHAVAVTSVQKDLTGNIEGFYICDSGHGTNDCAHFYTSEQLKDSLSSRNMNVTTSIIR